MPRVLRENLKQLTDAELMAVEFPRKYRRIKFSQNHLYDDGGDRFPGRCLFDEYFRSTGYCHDDLKIW